MRIRNTFIVLVLLAVVGVYAYYTSKQPAEEKTKLFKLKPEDIAAITLKYPGREIELAREAGKWMLVKPIKAEADETAANNIARAIADCEVKKTLEEGPASLEPFGLAKPEVIVTVATNDKRTLPGIEVGKTTPVGFSAYIKTTDKPGVLLTTSAFPPEVKKTVDELRNRALVKFEADDVQKITLERGDGSPVELDQQKGLWVIVKPAKYAADQAAVRQFLTSLVGTRIDEFVNDKPDSLSQFGLDKPRLTISVFTGKQAARQSLLFGARQSEAEKDAIYVRRGESAPVYTVHSYAFSDVNKTVNDLRDKTLMAFDPSTVERVKISAGAKSFTLERSADGKWQLVDGSSKVPADVVAVVRFLDRLRDQRGKSIVEDPISDPKKFGLDAPAEELTLTAKDGKLVGDLKLAKVERRNEAGGATPAPVVRTDYYVTSSASSAVYDLDNLEFVELTKTAKEFKPANAETPALSPNPQQPAGLAPPAPPPAK